MKILLMLGIVMLAAGPAMAAPGVKAEAEPPSPAPVTAKAAELPPGVKLAEAVSTTTGLAISPLLGVGAVGAWHYYHTAPSERDRMPWHANPWFWVPALCLVALLALKEPALYFLPGAKKPLDLLEVLENKASALIAAPIVIHLAIWTFSRASASPSESEVVTAGLTMDGWFGVVFGGIGLLAVFACVWLVSHAVNILILLSPSATLDILLRVGRTAVLAAVTLSAALNPWLGLVVAVVVIYVATRLFGWAWRLMFYGGTLTRDWIGGAKSSAPDARGRARAFLARPAGGLPARARGHLGLSVTGELVFTGRALPWQPERTVAFDASTVRLARGLIGPVLQDGDSPFAGKLASLPPRFAGAELALGRAWGINATAEHPAKRTWTGAITWLRDQQGRAALAGGPTDSR